MLAIFHHRHSLESCSSNILPFEHTILLAKYKFMSISVLSIHSKSISVIQWVKSKQVPHRYLTRLRRTHSPTSRIRICSFCLTTFFSNTLHHRKSNTWNASSDKSWLSYDLPRFDTSWMRLVQHPKRSTRHHRVDSIEDVLLHLIQQQFRWVSYHRNLLDNTLVDRNHFHSHLRRKRCFYSIF